MTRPPWVLAPPPDHPHGKNNSAHGHSEPLISSHIRFISSSHYTPLSRTCLLNSLPPVTGGLLLVPPMKPPLLQVEQAQIPQPVVAGQVL